MAARKSRLRSAANGAGATVNRKVLHPLGIVGHLRHEPGWPVAKREQALRAQIQTFTSGAAAGRRVATACRRVRNGVYAP